ncbi:hypothetical protein L209DRAFT_748875 [Thermothelomyces heterothallicus CBS 203.75]
MAASLISADVIQETQGRFQRAVRVWESNTKNKTPSLPAGYITHPAAGRVTLCCMYGYCPCLAAVVINKRRN